MEFSFERAAMRGDPLPHGMDLADQTAFIALRYLYGQHYAGKISREDAAAEKREVVRAWKRAKDESESARRTADFFRVVEKYMSCYRKNRKIEAADNLADAVDGFLRG